MGWNLVIQLVLEMVSILWIREKVLDIYQSAAPKVAYQNEVLYKICLSFSLVLVVCFCLTSSSLACMLKAIMSIC